MGGVLGRGACMVGGGDVHGRVYEIRSMSGRYASYWNAFLLNYSVGLIQLNGSRRYNHNYKCKYTIKIRFRLHL